MPPSQENQRKRTNTELELQSATEKAWEEVTAACQAYEQRLLEFQQFPVADLLQFMRDVAQSRDTAVDKYRDAVTALIDFLRAEGHMAANGSHTV